MRLPVTPDRFAHLTPSEREAWEIAERATPGPWTAYEASERCPLPAGCFVEVGTESGGGAKTGTICEIVAQGRGKYEPEVTAANALLIAHARTDIPALLATIAELREAVEKAPHGFDCESQVRQSECIGYGKCNCWKAVIGEREGGK